MQTVSAAALQSSRLSRSRAESSRQQRSRSLAPPTRAVTPPGRAVSRLSPYLHFGQISPRLIQERVEAAGGKKARRASFSLSHALLLSLLSTRSQAQKTTPVAQRPALHFRCPRPLRGASCGATSRTGSSTSGPPSRTRASARRSPAAAGPRAPSAPRASRRGGAAARASRSLTRGCGSCGPRAGCSRACGWSPRPSSSTSSTCPGRTARARLRSLPQGLPPRLARRARCCWLLLT